MSLRAMGKPNFTITADTPLYAAFTHPENGTTYMAYNAGDSELAVSFSDGHKLTVPPRSLEASIPLFESIATR